MKKFDRIARTAIEYLTEQSPNEVLGAAAPVDPNLAADPSMGAGEMAPQEAPPVEEPEQEVETLSPEAEVVLVKFIRKALLIDLSLEDKAKLINLIPTDKDIDQTNAKSILDTLQSIIGSYSTTKTTEEDKDKLNIPG